MDGFRDDTMTSNWCYIIHFRRLEEHSTIFLTVFEDKHHIDQPSMAAEQNAQACPRMEQGLAMIRSSKPTPR